MTQSQKALAIVKESYHVKQLKKKKKHIIRQQKQEKLNKEVKAKETSNLLNKQNMQLDDTEKNFINKYIEYTELTLLNSSAPQIIASFEKALGENASKAIDTLTEKTKQRETKINQLAKELTAIKQQIAKETEKVRAKVALTTLADKISVAKMPAKNTVKSIDNADPADIEDPTTTMNSDQQANVISSQNKKKKAKRK